MKVSPNEILIYYHPRHEIVGRLTAYARTITPYVHLVEADKTQYTTTHWKRILEWMNISDPKICMDSVSPYYNEFVERKDHAFEDLIHILSHHPEVLVGPIVIRGTKAILCDSLYDVFRLNQGIVEENKP